MTKITAQLLGYLLTGIASLCLFSGQYLFMLLLGIPGLFCLWLYVHKDERDKAFIVEAHQEREQAAHTPLELPPMMSRNSRQLFVPPPLYEHNKETM